MNNKPALALGFLTSTCIGFELDKCLAYKQEVKKLTISFEIIGQQRASHLII